MIENILGIELKREPKQRVALDRVNLVEHERGAA